MLREVIAMILVGVAVLMLIGMLYCISLPMPGDKRKKVHE